MHVLVAQPDLGRAWAPWIDLVTLRKFGYQVSFIGWDREGENPATIGDVVPELFRFRSGYANWRVVPGMLMWMCFVAWKVFWSDADVVQAFEIETALPAYLACLATGKSLVFNNNEGLHWRYAWPRPIYEMLQQLDGWLSMRADAVFVLNENRITKEEQPFLGKITIIYNTAPDMLAELNAEADVARPFTILAWGRIASSRGIDQLLAAVRSFPGIRVLMAGNFPDPHMEPTVKSHPQVAWLGQLPISKAIHLLANADLVYAFYEPDRQLHCNTSPSKLYEAMMAAKPCLVNSEITMARLVRDYGIGYETAYGDVDALVAVLRRILADPDRAEKGRRARELYDRQYSWKLMEARMLSVYELIAQRRRSRDRFTATSSLPSE